MTNKWIRFFLAILIGHVIAYLIAGGITYQLITKELWDSPDSLLANYLRTPTNTELWRYAMIWQIPAQLLRGLLIGVVLLPLLELQMEWRKSKKFYFYSSLIFVLTHFSAAVPSPANIEGLVYMKPEYIKLGFIKMQPEMLLYSLLFGFIISMYGAGKNKKHVAAKAPLT
jgi:hypothetical protein